MEIDYSLDMNKITKHPNGLFPIPLWQFVLVLKNIGAESWDERGMRAMVKTLNRNGDDVLYHMSASNSSLSDYVHGEGIDLSGKTAHCDVQHSVWKLNLDAGNDKCPIDPLWSENSVRFFRNGASGGSKWIHLPSFAHAVQYAKELRLRPYKQAGRGVICPARDGCFCRSFEEVRVDDWLFENGLEHIKEPAYPRHPIYNKTGRKRGDWLVGDVYVEYAGLLSDKAYEKRLLEKVTMCEELGLTLIVLTRDDLNQLDTKLRPLLK